MAQTAVLRELGHEVRILTPRPRKHLDLPGDGVIFVGGSAKIKTPLKTSLELGMSLTRNEVDDILAEEKFDILHIHEPEVPIIGSQILAKAICPVVATFHAIHPETPMARTIETFRIPFSRSIFSKLSAMTAVSDAAAIFVRERTTQEVQIIPNGIDLAKYTFNPQPASSGRKMILYIGRLEKRKGVRYLLKAYQQLVEKDANVELVIAGDGELRESLEAFVDDNKLPHVGFLGYIEESEKLDLLHKATVFCSPALYGESFGIVLLEAMASGTVTVAGANPGYSSVLQGTGSLSLVDPKQSDEFARRLELLLSDHELRAAWLNWAESYVQQFDYHKVVARYEILYKQVLKKK
jgi:phosphatidylinositol alpha-mannosyltransferase